MKRLGPFDIFEQGLRRLRRDLGAAAIPLLLGVATLFVGGISWGVFLADKANISTSAKHSDLTGVFHRIVYGALRTVSDFAPSVWNVNEGNYGTDAAAILGAAAFYASLVLIGANVMAETIRRLAARYLYEGHAVIVGETPLATRVTRVWLGRNRRAVQVVPSGRARPKRASAQVRSAMDRGLLARFGLARAADVVIDLGEDIATLSLAQELLSGFHADAERTRASTRRPEWTLVVRDQTLLEQFAGHLRALHDRAVTESIHALDRRIELPLIRYVSPERAIVRRFLAARPLFLGKPPGIGIHALIVGAGPAVDELIKAIFQTSLVAGQDRPRVTIVSKTPAADRSAFFAGRPGLIGEVDVVFLDPLALDDFEPAVRLPRDRTVTGFDTTLRDRDAACPVTEIFLMSENADDNTRLAVRFKQIRAKTGRLNANIFGCEWRISEQPAAATTFVRAIEGYETFGLDDRFLEDEFCRSTIRRTLAFALHENYRRASKDPVPPWDRLSETLRRANQNAADHALAKLHMLGFDIGRVRPGAIPRLSDEDNRALRGALQAQPLSGSVRDIVFLEHDRWSIERRFDGWIFGATRDDPKLIHNLLVSWDELTQAEQDKDRDQVEALRQCLEEHGDPALVLQRRADADVSSHLRP